MSGIEYKKGRITGTVKILPPPPAKTLPSKAELQLSKMPGVPINYTSVNTYRDVPQPSMQNYALQIQLSKIADASVMKPSELNYKKAFQADGTTPEMLEAYKQMERADLYKQGIFRPNYDIDLINIPNEEQVERLVESGTNQINRESDQEIQRIRQAYKAKQDEIRDLYSQKSEIRAFANKLSGQRRIESRPMIENAFNQIEIDIANARQELNAFNGMIGTVETERKELLDDIKAQKARIGEIKKTNDKTFRKYEEDLRSLNQGFIVGRMVGESDQDYKDRLLTFERENVEAITQQEAGMYNNMVFKTNLKKVVRLPVHLEEELIKKLGQANLFSINEKWPLYEKKFIETYGKFPVMGERNSLVNFFTSVVPVKPPLPPGPPPRPPRPTGPTLRPPSINLRQFEVKAPSKEQKAPSKDFIDPRFVSSRPTGITREQLQTYSTSPAGTRSVGTQSAPQTREIGTQLRAANIGLNIPYTSERKTSKELTNKELVELIKSKGGRANLSMTKAELKDRLSNLS